MLDPAQLPFQQVLEALLDEKHILKPINLYRLSGLEGEERELLAKHWNDIPARRRRALIQDLELFAEADPLLCYEPVARIGLQDSDPEVRLVSIRLLWDEDSPNLEHVLLDMLENDEDERVRAGAGSALGHFVYLGECEKIPEHTLREIEERLLATVRGDEHPLVRRRALEALGFSGRPEVTGLIENAFLSDDDEWIASALFAMGRSYNQRWHNDVLEMLDSHNPRIRMEAARAAGELEIKAAVSTLRYLLDDADAEVRMAAIWSLSQIGGEGVAEALEALLDLSEDPEEIEHLEAALDNLAFNEEFLSFPLFDFSEDDLSSLHEINDDTGGF